MAPRSTIATGFCRKCCLSPSRSSAAAKKAHANGSMSGDVDAKMHVTRTTMRICGAVWPTEKYR